MADERARASERARGAQGRGSGYLILHDGFLLISRDTRRFSKERGSCRVRERGGRKARDHRRNGRHNIMKYES
eukprot:scaffold2885_cov24-Tisochrysis_lutea.AAC.1